MMAFPLNGQAQFLKKLNKALETVNKTLDDINQKLDPEKQSQQAVEKVVTEKKNEAVQTVTSAVNDVKQQTVNQVAAKVALAAVPRTDKGVVKTAGTDLLYQKTVNTSSYSLTSTYTITQGSQAGEVEASFNEQGAYSDGRFIPASENYYKGKQLGWCIVLDQQVSYDDTCEKLETPIVIYAADAAGRKIVVEGETYTLTRESY